MFVARFPASLLLASLLASGVACSSDAPSTPPVRSGGSPVAAPPPASSPPALAPEASTFAASSGSSALATRAEKSPIQALNQMVTAQALLVSLLLAPLSTDSVEGPLARADASANAPTR